MIQAETWGSPASNLQLSWEHYHSREKSSGSLFLEANWMGKEKELMKLLSPENVLEFLAHVVGSGCQLEAVSWLKRAEGNSQR